MKFESTTKPERNAQNGHLEHTILTLSRGLQWFSKRKQISKILKSTDLAPFEKTLLARTRVQTTAFSGPLLTFSRVLS